MNRLLEKFLKKIVILQNFTIINQDELGVVLVVPITIEVEKKFEDEMSFQPKIMVVPTQVPMICLCTTDKNSEKARIFASKGIAVLSLTMAGSGKKGHELEKEIPEDLHRFYLKKDMK